MKLMIQGTRGIPASHGGFETFAEKLALYLKDKGWSVTVYCEKYADSKTTTEWNGITLHHIPIRNQGPLGTIIFDFRSIMDSLKSTGPVLTLGYNTAIFNIIYRLSRKKNIINMDGIEWKRSKWSMPIQAWFYVNELFGCLVGNHLVADNPHIQQHLARWGVHGKTTMIPYGADEVLSGDVEVLHTYGLEENRYAIIIARPEPENSILEMVRAFCASKRSIKLVVLGKYDEQNAYHAAVLAAANDSVSFVGAIYDADVVKSLRFFCRFYMHGHQVGGTNPSLVETMGAGNAVIAHDNRFNRWVVGNGAVYFSTVEECERQLNSLIEDDELVETLKQASFERFQQEFTWDKILQQYEKLLSEWQ